MSSSSSNQFTSNFYGHQPTNSLGMGSLQNLSSRSPLSQLARSNGGGSGGFNSTVGGDRLTPSNTSSGGGGYANPITSSGNTSNRQSTMGMNLLQSSSTSTSSSNRNPLFSRDRGKIDSSLSPNTFDPSEFPSLGNRDNSAPNPSLSARPNYVGMVKQPAMEASEFTMSHEDFPALPGYKPPSSHDMATSVVGGTTTFGGGGGSGGGGGNGNAGGNGGSGGGNSGSSSSLAGMGGSNGLNNISLQSAKLNTSQGLFSEASLSEHQIQQPRGIITSQDGMVTNIPGSMVTDQFGMIGLLTFIRAAETDPNLVSLALGADLTALGLNLNSEVNLHPTFAGPWAETPCRPQDIDYHVPQEYLTNTSIRDKLAPVKLNRYKDDVLFYMFYTNVGDVLQLAAAAELYSRDWRFHKDDRVWITRAPGMVPSEKTSSYERGTYYFFDVTNWRKVPKDFYLDYDKLEDRPSLPTNLTAGQTSSSPAPSGVPTSTNGPSSGMPPPQHSPQLSSVADTRPHGAP